MTEEIRARYEGDKEHYDLLSAIVKDAQAPTNTILKTYIGISVLVFGFMFLTQFGVWQKLSEKADKSELTEAVKERERDYITKLDYYKIEADEHESLKEAFANQSNAAFIIEKINANIRRELGFNYTTNRGGIK